MRLIPAIDLRGGRCVRLLQGRFDAETIYAEDPSEVLSAYIGLGARYLHLVDLDAARGEPQVNRRTVESLAQNGMAALQVGGGIRSREALEQLLALKVQRAVVGSVAVSRPAEVRE
jgi:phosphoribosylformimino-5-aminoimidazole carboxamide ribotide isomerase